MMRRVGHRPASQTRCRFVADAAVALTAVTRKRTIASCCQAVARQTQAQPAQSRLRPPKTKCPNTHSNRGTATAPPPAGSFPAGFRTPAPVPVASSARAGIRNPQHERTNSGRPETTWMTRSDQFLREFAATQHGRRAAIRLFSVITNSTASALTVPNQRRRLWRLSSCIA